MADTDPSYTLLVVEDDLSLRKSLQLTLRKYNFRILEATNGRDALRLFGEESVHGVLLDALMPVLDGFETCRQMRAMAEVPGAATMPILLMTGLNDEASIDRAYNAGATDYVLKPVHLGVLAHRLQRLVRTEALEDELAQTRTEFETVFRSIPDAVLLTDEKRAIVTCNRAFERSFGYRADEVKGEFTQVLYADPEDFEQEDARIFGDDPEANCEFLYRTHAGDTFWGETLGAPVAARDGARSGYLYIIRDVTERKRHEEEKVKADRLEVMGLLAGGIAHDFNNIIASLMTHFSLARSELPASTAAAQYLAECQPALDQATHLAQQLLTFAKGGAPIKKLVDLRKLVRETVQFALRATRSVGVFRLAEDAWAAEVDESQIVQVLSNLVINADQAMGGGGTVTVSLTNRTLGEDDGNDLPAGSYISLEVSDNGPGMPPEVLERVFDPYYTTKKTGNGLGLATVYSVIRKHDGHITVQSRPGKGTTFRCLLPARPNESPRPRRTVQTLPPMRAGGTSARILVLEDQEIIRKGVTRLLEREGYTVTCAEEGSIAVAAYEKSHGTPEQYDLCLLDMTIPGGMDGRETLERLRAINGQLPAIVSSGYCDDPVMANPQEYGFQGVLPKPFAREELVRVVAEVLAQAPAQPTRA